MMDAPVAWMLVRRSDGQRRILDGAKYNPASPGFWLDEPSIEAHDIIPLVPETEVAKLVADAEAAERERCARVAENEGVYPELNVFAGGPDWYRHGKRIAAAIRRAAEETGT